MSVILDSLSDVAGWLAASLTGLLLWNARAHISDDKEKHAAADKRLNGLETNHVTISDIAAIHRQMSALRSEMADNHAEILKILIDKG